MMPAQMNKEDVFWNLLLRRIKEGKCTPFLGAGACHGVLPLGSEIAEEWAQKEGFPLDDCSDLARVAQFLAVNYDAMYPKGQLIDQFIDVPPPQFDNPYEPHRVLADLPLPIYITTNYDSFMFQALRSRGKEPVQEVCRWNNSLKEMLRDEPSVLATAPRSQINKDTPVVFHLHGHAGIQESLVLTEDDYLDFLVNISKEKDTLPPKIREVMAGTSLLFLGYRLNDWNFRVLFRSVISYLEKSISRAHISVQLVQLKDADEEKKQRAQEYLSRYFDDVKIRVYWGSCHDFAEELRNRWEKFNGN